MNKFEELLEQYGKTIEEVTFEYENLSDEELEVAFKEAFEEAYDDGEPIVEEPVTEEPTEPVAEGGEPEGGPAPEEKFVVKYELSHDDIRSALYNLLSAVSEDGYSYAWIAEVYDSKFIYCDYYENKFYRQGYTRDGDNVSLEDNKVEVFSEWLSKEEKDALDALKADYASLVEFKANTEAAQLQAQKDAIFASEEFANIVETKAFTKLVENSKNYTVEECEQMAKDILDDCNDYVTNFAAKNDGKQKPKVIGFAGAGKPEKEKPYGDIFDD